MRFYVYIPLKQKTAPRKRGADFFCFGTSQLGKGKSKPSESFFLAEQLCQLGRAAGSAFPAAQRHAHGPQQLTVFDSRFFSKQFERGVKLGVFPPVVGYALQQGNNGRQILFGDFRVGLLLGVDVQRIVKLSELLDRKSVV